MLFLETSSSGPIINNAFLELPVSNFLQRSDSNSSKRILCSKKIKGLNFIIHNIFLFLVLLHFDYFLYTHSLDFIHTTWEHSPVPIPDSKELVDILVKIEAHKKAVFYFQFN